MSTSEQKGKGIVKYDDSRRSYAQGEPPGMYEDRDLYLAAINGDVQHFQATVDRISASKRDSRDGILSRLSLVGNTFLHVAAKNGNLNLVRYIAGEQPTLGLAKNSKGDTILHIAANRGDETMVIDIVGILPELLMVENELGNTASHQAILGGWESIATVLIQQEPELSYHQNKAGESAIYLAVKAGLVECITCILPQCTDDSRLNQLLENKSPIQAAIERKDMAVLSAMIDLKWELIKMIDGEGRNPLHLAASSGNLEAARYLLAKYPLNATRRDKGGELPIHLAALGGHVAVISLLLRDFPEVDELVDMSGQNILHKASWMGRVNVVSYVLKNPILDCLINMKDEFGSTPLHMAMLRDNYRTAGILTRDKRVDTISLNNKGLTAVEAAEEDKRLKNQTYIKV